MAVRVGVGHASSQSWLPEDDGLATKLPGRYGVERVWVGGCVGDTKVYIVLGSNHEGDLLRWVVKGSHSWECGKNHLSMRMAVFYSMLGWYGSTAWQSIVL